MQLFGGYYLPSPSARPQEYSGEGQRSAKWRRQTQQVSTAQWDEGQPKGGHQRVTNVAQG